MKSNSYPAGRPTTQVIDFIAQNGHTRNENATLAHTYAVRNCVAPK
jgi:hypothetical protein